MNDTRQQLLDNVLAVVAELEGNGDYRDIYSWLDDQLSIEEYKVTADGNFKGGEVLCCYGGPTVWVETDTDTVHGAWGGDSIERSYDDNLGLHDALEELYQSMRG